VVRTRTARIIAIAAILCLVASACSSKKPTATTKEGGSIVVAAEQFPDCLNVIDTCSNASWLHWAVAQNVLPKAMTLDPQNNFVASPVLAHAPTLENGGLKQSPFTITYDLDPGAVWDDGTPITWEDFEFTWQAVLKTKGSLSSLGYDKIKSIAQGKDIHQVVIVFTEIYADWQDLFGGSSTNGYILKKAAFPKGPDTAGTMQTSIDFSGAAWKLQSFTKNQQLILVKNPKFWGAKPHLDQVTFVAREDQSTELQSLYSGEVVAAYPQPSGGNLSKDLSGKPGVSAKFGSGTTYEGFWINMTKAPMDDQNVRQAFAYAIDRQAIVDTILKPNNPDATVLNCAGWVPTVSDWCHSNDYAGYTYQPDKAKTLLTTAGYTCPATGFCTKGGKKLTITITTTAGNKGRADQIAIAQDKAKAAGIDIQLATLASPSPIFTDFLPKRQHVVADYANVASPDPSVTSFLSCEQIPKADGSGGQNWSGWCNQDATAKLKAADQELDHNKRRDLLHAVGALEATELPWIPLYQKPLITAFRSDKLAGPVDEFTSSPLSCFYNMAEWSSKV
jgi:peptide/nickel transport system substrate-binding protein